MLNLCSFNVNDAPYYYGCKVCGNKFKTESGQYNHIDRLVLDVSDEDHRHALLNEMNEIITKEYKLGEK